jgi:hypothetical protein
MSRATGRKPFLVELAEGNLVDLLTERLRFEQQSLLLPVPHCE